MGWSGANSCARTCLSRLGFPYWGPSSTHHHRPCQKCSKRLSPKRQFVILGGLFRQFQQTRAFASRDWRGKPWNDNYVRGSSIELVVHMLVCVHQKKATLHLGSKKNTSIHALLCVHMPRVANAWYERYVTFMMFSSHSVGLHAWNDGRWEPSPLKL